MKKLLVYLLIIAALFALLYFINLQSKKANEPNPQSAGNIYGKTDLHPETAALLDNPNYQNIILPNELKTDLKEKADMFVYFFSSTCPHCIRTTPVLVPIAKEANIDLKQFNLLEFNEGWAEYGVEETPTLVYYKDGKEVGRMVGGIPEEGSTAGYTEEDFRSFFEKYK